jgi:hypothetical protein
MLISQENPGCLYRLPLKRKITKTILTELFTGERRNVKRIKTDAPGSGG